jgi:hypothetical protein
VPRFLRIFGGIGLAGLLVGLAVGVYAFTNTLGFDSNTTPVSLAYNNTAAPAYTASKVHYNNVTQNTWNSFTFNLDNAISNDATITVSDGSGTFIGANAGAGSGTLGGCAVDSATHKHWTCTASANQSTDSVTSFSIQLSQ